MTFAALKGRKSSPNMRSTSPAPPPRGASPAPPVPRHQADVFSDVTNASANAGLGIQAGPGHHGAGAGTGSGGFAKLLSFPWHRGGEKGKAPSPTPPRAIAGASPLDFNAPLPSPPWTSSVPPFPRPPTHTPTRQNAPPPPPPQPVQHASAAVIPAQLTGATSVSTMSTSSSFASTALFTDDWESEDGGSTQDSSIASSPEGSQPRRMWKVRDGTQPYPTRKDATPYSPLRKEMSTVVEEAPESPSHKRTSTPGPGGVGMSMMLLAGPATPPRLIHRLSASSKPSPTSPPFDPLFERAVAEGRTRTFPPSPQSPEESGDADDEVSPPRARRGMRRASLGSPQKLLGESSTELAYADGFRMRIPSIRFEGISMDAVFAEVEKKMGDDREKKANRRRTRVLSTYRPFGSDASFGSSEGTAPPSLSTSHDSFSTLESGSPSTSSGSLVFQLNEHEYATLDRAQSTTPTPRSHHAATRPQPPRRSSSRPAPLNVAAANAIPTSAPQQRSPVISPRTPTFSTASARSPMLPPKSPMSPATAAFSPSALGDAFFPIPSPALSSTSTMRGPPSPVPELWVRPPTPEREREPLPSPLPSPRLNGPMGPYTSSHPGTKVVVVQEKRQVKLSSRASTGPKRRPTLSFETVPPPAPAAPAYATPPATPSFGNLGPVTTPGGSPARYSMGASSGDETDVEDALNSMLVRLAQPHTPPSSPSYTSTTHSSPAPLTLKALELHTSQQSLAKLARPSPPSPTTFPATPVESPTSTKRLSSAYSTASSEQRLSSASLQSWPRRGSDSDDSAARFGDAPLTPPQLGRPRSPLSSARKAAPLWTEMAMPDEIRVTPATPSHSAQSSISSAFQASLLPTVLHSRLQTVETHTPRPESSSEEEPTSGEESTEGGEDGYDSMDLADLAETAIVMMGERISCGYEIGVAV